MAYSRSSREMAVEAKLEPGSLVFHPGDPLLSQTLLPAKVFLSYYFPLAHTLTRAFAHFHILILITDALSGTPEHPHPNVACC